MMNVQDIRADFPILGSTVHGRPLVYLDNAATTHKPRQVLDRVQHFYASTNSNIHRGVHHLSEQASGLYEEARKKVAGFIHAGDAREVVFTRGTTESINLVAGSYGQAFVEEGDEIIITEMEHHSNIVPWQMLCERKGATLKYVPLEEDGTLDLSRLANLITGRTRLVSLTWVSHVLGTVNDVNRAVEIAHAREVPVLVDAAQAVQHMPVDVQDLGCDFLVFSGHKIFAETGIGVLYGKEKWLDVMPPWQGGGAMISSVTMDRTDYAGLPLKFEAGTGHFVGADSLAAALEYVDGIGLESIDKHESELLDYVERRLRERDGVIVHGQPERRCGVLSFSMEQVHPYDAGLMLDKMGVAVRTGMLCAEPLMRRYGLNGAIRASFALYNTKDEVDRLVEAVDTAREMLVA